MINTVQDHIDFFKAVILGHAVGDALGVPAEFDSREVLSENPVTDMRSCDICSLPAGSWSDDTSMTLCALESLGKGKVDLQDVMENFGKWYYKGEFSPFGYAFGIGNTCKNAIENYFEHGKDIKHCGLTGEQDNGNGALMRILPFCLCEPWNLTLFMDAGALTHAHQRNKIACAVYAIILNDIRTYERKSIVPKSILIAKDLFGQDPEWKHFERLLNIQKLPQEQINSTGYVIDTLEAAVWCLLTTESYHDCVLKAVNLGGDTDTVAAVAGGLAGALYGLNGIDKAWLNTLQRREYIEDLCEKAALAFEE